MVRHTSSGRLTCSAFALHGLCFPVFVGLRRVRMWVSKDIQNVELRPLDRHWKLPLTNSLSHASELAARWNTCDARWPEHDRHSGRRSRPIGARQRTMNKTRYVMLSRLCPRCLKRFVTEWPCLRGIRCCAHFFGLFSTLRNQQALVTEPYGAYRP